MPGCSLLFFGEAGRKTAQQSISKEKPPRLTERFVNNIISRANQLSVMNSTPMQLGPQWEEMVQPARVT